MGNGIHQSCGAVEGDIHRRSIHRWPQQDVPASLRISVVVFFLALEMRHRPVVGIRASRPGDMPMQSPTGVTSWPIQHGFASSKNSLAPAGQAESAACPDCLDAPHHNRSRLLPKAAR
jgi:hypothetical protein